MRQAGRHWLGLTLIPALFYTCTGAFAASPDWICISILYITASSLPKSHPDRIDYPKLAGRFEPEIKMQESIRSQQTSWALVPFRKA